MVVVAAVAVAVAAAVLVLTHPAADALSVGHTSEKRTRLGFFFRLTDPKKRGFSSSDDQRFLSLCSTLPFDVVRATLEPRADSLIDRILFGTTPAQILVRRCAHC